MTSFTELSNASYFKMNYPNGASVAVNKKCGSSKVSVIAMIFDAHEDADLQTMKIKTCKQQQTAQEY